MMNKYNVGDFVYLLLSFNTTISEINIVEREILEVHKIERSNGEMHIQYKVLETLLDQDIRQEKELFGSLKEVEEFFINSLDSFKKQVKNGKLKNIIR